MTKARLEFKDKKLYSLDFNDIYFDSLEEASFTYSKNFEFSQHEHFIIAELGFGMGLNFFLTLQRFLNTKNRPKRLFYVSLEGFYIEKELLLEFYKKFDFYDEFKPFLEPFLKVYPRCKDGIYRFYFEDAFLDLVFGEATKSIKELDFKADLWYLDGFKPSVNSRLFDENILKEVARLCKNGAYALSFSSASSFQRALRANGFFVEKIKGFKKREMIRAVFGEELEFKANFEAKFKEEAKIQATLNTEPECKAEIQATMKENAEFANVLNNKYEIKASTEKKFKEEAKIQATLNTEPECKAEIQARCKEGLEFKANIKKEPEFKANPKDKEAYYARVCTPYSNKKIAIIGSGIASACLAYELSLRNFKVTVFEKNDSFASGASGNESAILSPLILKKEALLGEFSEFAFYEASRFYRQILGIVPSGAIQKAHTQEIKERFKAQKDSVLFEIKDDTAFIKDAVHLRPKQILSSLFKNANLNFNYEFTRYSYENNEFCLKFKDKADQKGFGVLIYAMGAQSEDFLRYEAMKLSTVRGQLTHIKPCLKTPYPLLAKGYICPALSSLQVIGASYDRLDTSLEPSLKDDLANIANIKEFLQTEPEIIGSRASLRSYSSDRFMICGSFYDECFYKNAYKDLLWSKNKPQIYPKSTLPLYFSLAHGSRGFASAVIAARYLCALICNEPLFIPKKFISQIHPARFLIRRLKKGL